MNNVHVAQLDEHSPPKAEDAGSTPVVDTTYVMPERQLGHLRRHIPYFRDRK